MCWRKPHARLTLFKDQVRHAFQTCAARAPSKSARCLKAVPQSADRQMTKYWVSALAASVCDRTEALVLQTLASETMARRAIRASALVHATILTPNALLHAIR